MGVFSRLAYIQIGFTIGIIYSVLPMAWIYDPSFKHTPSSVVWWMLICFILCFILCQIYEGRIFFKGCVVGSLLTLLPFGILIYALPQTSNSTLGLVLLTTGIVFSVYQGIRSWLDPDEHALLGRILRDGLHTPKWYWDKWSADIDKSVEAYFDSNRNKKETKEDDEEKVIPVGLPTPSNLSFSMDYKKEEKKGFGDNSGPNPAGLRYKTLDGHMVRSKAEMLIANWLTNNHIQYFYEKPAPGTPYFCDFYLPEQDMYIEYWGRIDDPEYRECMDQKIEAYQKQGLGLISITDEDIQKDLDAVLQQKITNNNVVVPNNTAEKEKMDEIKKQIIEEEKNNYWE